MSRYILIRRLRGPAILLLIGVMALLSQANILGWGQSWPLILILLGLLLLAERAALASEGYPPPPGTPWQNTGAGTVTGQTSATGSQPTRGTGNMPSEHEPFGDEIHGGQS
ncbi:MAG TPA: hypothetical protein VMT38_10445 [Terracidiphilus sp.]|nr:hypothetical protein [Terracidiphilus sp.]